MGNPPVTDTTYKPELIKVPHHELTYAEADRRDVNSFRVEEIRNFNKAQSVLYARATGLKETGMSVNEVGLLYDLLEKKGACNIVELGRNFGTSTRLFIQHVIRHGGYFESLDLRHWGNLEETFINQGFEVRPSGDDYILETCDRLIAHIRISDSIKTHIKNENRWVDFLLIDTEHGLENALGEYMRWRQYLKSGAFIAFHDLCIPGVARAIEIVKEVELVTCGDRIIREWQNERVDGYGVSILEWKG